MSLNAPEIAVIGGGTGSFTLLQELKEFTPNITAVVNMSDDGGGSGMLRDELGVLPPGDIRQCLVALSDLPEVRDLFGYRFNAGSLTNQSLGNIILSGLELQYDSLEKAIEVASTILQIKGRVIPVTTQKHTLVMRDGNDVIRGENIIGKRAIKQPGAYVELDPPSAINPRAAEAILGADIVVIAPGNLHGSLLPALAVNGMAEAFQATSAKKVAIANLVTKPGQTDGWHVADYFRTFESYVGQGQIDKVIYNNVAPSEDLLKKYAEDGEFPVGIAPERLREVGAKAIGAALVAQEIFAQDKNDTILRRTLIRHDAIQVGRQLMRIFYE